MRKSPLAICLVFLLTVVVAFLAGTRYARRTVDNIAADPPAQTSAVLHYSCPMHPQYVSDRQGSCPICGMTLEPVRAPESETSRVDEATDPQGSVRIDPQRQQIIGVRLGTAERISGKQKLRTVGRVVPDENRTYRILTGTDGWIRGIFGGTTGSIVQKDELLATLYNRDFLTAEQGLIYTLNSLERFKKQGMDSPEQVASSENQIRAAEDNLRALGMGDLQIAEIASTRNLTREIAVRAPATGLVIARNVFPGLRFDRATELYRIVDLSTIWVLADVFQNEASYFQPGVTAQVSLSQYGKTFEARVTDVPPAFDPGSRTLKVRLEAKNPSFLLRPDMFVDVELSVTLPEAVSVPADAVLDSGLHKHVFVDRGKGHFEPRTVETGWHFGDNIAISKGLMPGERIVVSGAFLVDSESRMRAAAAPAYGNKVTDPVCGMELDENKAKAEGKTATYNGRTYYFCSDECKRKFDKNPGKYTRQPDTR